MGSLHASIQSMPTAWFAAGTVAAPNYGIDLWLLLWLPFAVNFQRDDFHSQNQSLLMI